MGDFERDRRNGDPELRAQLEELRADFSELKEQIEAVMQKQDAQTAATAALVEAWQTGTGVVKFIKWLASVSGALATLWAITHADMDAMLKAIFK